ncbi:hypothetical protein [Cellulosimicrobium sp. CpK407]|uniref:hypothetical protein n=1 Tax=Cellulosimicrobium sp. CpK407 TaxID=3229847 RepID=UPI003F2C2C23
MSENQNPAVPGIRDGAPIPADAVADALTRARFAYTDGTDQVFTPDGRTTFTEQEGRESPGEWGVDEHGRFWSFWPPSYRAEYDVFWIAEDGQAVGVRFVERARGASSEGRYTGQ